MRRGKRRGPKQLRFRALLEALAQAVDRIVDHRQAGKLRYSLQDCYRSSFAMFYLQDPSLLEFQRRFQDQIQRNNLTTVFGVETIPSDTQLRAILDSHDYAPLLDVYREYFTRMQRAKQLERYRFYQGYYLITLDGSEYFNSEAVNCGLCLSRQKSGGEKEYYHQVLQAAMVHPALRQVIPLAPEFIRVQEGESKQDCELNAGKRIIKKIRRDHPQLPMIIVADALYSKAPFIELLRAGRFSFCIGVKAASHKSLFEEIEGLRRGGMIDVLEREGLKGRRYVYEWVNEVPLNGRAGSPIVNYMGLRIYNSKGKLTRRFSWVSDIEIREDNVEQLVRGARARWKIENENFNTLKNHGYHLEHNFGHGSRYLSETFFVLNVVAFFMHQIFSIVDCLYQAARGGFSSRVEYWNAIRASFRLFLFESWDQVLERINGPPLPIFQ